MQKIVGIISVAILLMLSACDAPSGQNSYDSRDVGMNATVLFGSIVSERPVQIKAEDTGVGGLAGGVGGGVLGSLIGAGKGSVLGALGGAIAGVFIGNEVEKDMGKRTGMEYIIHLDNGSNQSIVQNVAPNDVPLAVGERVMIQMQGSYRRVLPLNATTISSVPANATLNR